MIKLTLHGEREEIAQLEEVICNCGSFRVLNISDYYKDRGASVYERVYMDVELVGASSAKPRQTKLIMRGGRK